jgi:hypothetical protein
MAAKKVAARFPKVPPSFCVNSAQDFAANAEPWAELLPFCSYI